MPRIKSPKTDIHTYQSQSKQQAVSYYSWVSSRAEMIFNVVAKQVQAVALPMYNLVTHRLLESQLTFEQGFISCLKRERDAVMDTSRGYITFELKEIGNDTVLGIVNEKGKVKIIAGPWEEGLERYLRTVVRRERAAKYKYFVEYGELKRVWQERGFTEFRGVLVANGLVQETEEGLELDDIEIGRHIHFRGDDRAVKLDLYLKWVNRYGHPDEETTESNFASRLVTGGLVVSGSLLGVGVLKGVEQIATKVNFGQGFVAANSLVLSCTNLVAGQANPGIFGLAALVYFSLQTSGVSAELDTYYGNSTFAEVLTSTAYGNAETGYLAGTASTGYAVAGGSGLDAKFMLLDSSFGLSWGRMLNESVSFEISGIARTTDQSLVVVGSTTLGAGAGDGVVLKVNAAGEKVFAKTIGDTDENRLTAVAATTDGGFIAGGYVEECSSTWFYNSSLASLPGVRSFHDTIAVNGKIYVIGGNEDSSGVPLESTLVYDVATNVWTTLGPMLSPAYYTASVSLDGKIYVLGGRANSADFDVLREYNPTTDLWSSKTPMSVAKRAVAAAVVDGKIYIFGGFCDGVGYLVTVEMYDPSTDSWNSLAPMVVAREGAKAVTINGKIYVIGGQNSSGSPDDAVEEYDPVKNSWRTKASMLTARNYHSAVVINGKIYVLGGVDTSDTRLKSVEVYDPVTDSWSLHDSLATAKFVFATNLGSRLYIIGGYDGSYTSAVESYIPNIGPRAILTKLSTSGLLEWGKRYYLTQSRLSTVVPITGGYVALGSAELPDGSTHMLLLKTDATGTVTLSRTYGIPYGIQEGSQIVVTATGYVMAGYNHDTLGGVIVKVDTSGTVLWSKQVGIMGEVVITNIRETLDGGVIVAATINGEDTVVFKLASDGSLSWSRLWSVTGSVEKLTSIIQDASGNYILLGATDQLSWPKLDTVLMRLSPSGEFLDDCGLFTTAWNDIADFTLTSGSITLTTGNFAPTLAVAPALGLKDIDIISRSLCATESGSSSEAWTRRSYFANRYTSTSYGDVTASALVPMTSGYALAGGDALDMKVTSLDSDFYPSWTRMFASSIDFTFGGLVQTQDGGLVLGGSTTSIGAGEADILAVKIDENGSRVWSETIGDACKNMVRAIIATSDGGVAIAGFISEHLNTWSSLASLPEARAYHAVVDFEGNIYAFGGNNAGVVLSSTVVYDVVANSWVTRASSIPDPGYYLAATALGSKIYVLGGLSASATSLDAMREYNPSTDQWELKQPMLTSREYPGVAVVGSNIYVFGGYERNGAGFLSSVEMYDPVADTWTTRTSMSNARNSFTATVVNGKVYCIGGQTPSVTNVVEEYNPTLDTWTSRIPMPTARFSHGASLYEGRIYVYGGEDGNGDDLDTVEVYDPTFDSWSSYANIGAARQVWSSIIDGKIYVVGGTSSKAGTYYNDVYSYKLSADEKGLITKLTTQGVHAWSRSYQSTAITFNAILQTTDDGYLALGSTANIPQAMILQRTTATGLHSWAKTYSGNWVQEGHGLIATTTGYMLWGSSYESDSYYVGIMAKLDTTGNVLWSKRIGTGLSTSKVITSIKETSDNGFLVTAFTADGSVLFKLNSSGELQWSRVWSTSAEERLSALATEANGDILVLGTTDQFNSPKIETILMRLDSTGGMDGSCVLAESSWNVTADCTLTVASITPTVTSITPTVTDASVDVRAISLEVENTCYRPSVATSLASQAGCCDATIGYSYGFTFDEDTFDVASIATYSATLADGSDLPSWLTFTAGARSFTGTPTGSATNLAIKVTATDVNGGTATDTFTLQLTGSLTVTNAGGAISYTEDTAYNMPDIEVSTPSSTVTATLSLSDSTAGSFNTATSGGVTSSYNAATGVWEASGAKDDVNSLLAGLVFTPATDKSGAFSIIVDITDGYSQTASSTITASGVPVNDAPVITEVTKTGSEDTIVTFAASDFTSHYTDTEGTALASIQITSLPAHGSLLLDGVAVTVDQEIATADISKLTFVPEGEWSGSASFGWKASDGTDYSMANVVSLTVSAVNDAPVITEVTKTGSEDTTVTFAASDFTSHYTDTEGTALASIQITSLPAHGSLLLDGVVVTVDQEIVAADLSRLTFVPDGDWYGTTSFGWRASDGVDYSVANTVRLTVTAASDVPVITQITKTGDEDTTVTFTASDFTGHYTDAEGDALANIQITSLPLHGSLLLDGTAVMLNQVIVAADLSRLTFVPDGDWYGTTSFGWCASDGTAYSAANTVSLTLSAVNDVPVITEVTKTAAEDTTITFTLSDFTNHYTDVDGDTLAAIQITSLPAHGSLLLDGTAVTLNQVIAAADLSKLTLVPEGDWHGATSFGWRAFDGTAYSAANTVSLSISAVNDRPVLVSNAMYVTQGQTVILTEDMLSATDVDTTASALVFKVSDVTHGRFELITDPGIGILSFTQQQITSRQVRFVHDGTTAAPSYKVAVSDGNSETIATLATLTFEANDASEGMNLAPVIAGVVGGVVAVGAAIFGVMGYRKWKANKELAANQKVWNFDYHLRPSVSRVHGYRLITAKAVDTQKVVDYYQRCPVPGMDIKSVQIIFTPDQEQGFAARIKLLQEREGRAAFEPKWRQEVNAGLRTEVMARLNQMVIPYHDDEYGAVKFIPMWHGTRPEILDSIFKTGYADLSTTDEGFFGKGLYSAYEARYAYKVYSKGALLVNWVTFFSAYPVIEGDMPRLSGKGNYGNYDAHFIPVRPRTADPDEVNFYPCIGMHEAVYHEMVVFQAEQCLPRYLVELQPSLPQSPAVMVSISPSMITQDGSTPEQTEPLASSTSQSVSANPHAFFMPVLSPVVSGRQPFRGTPVTEPFAAVPPEPSESRGHHHRHHHKHKGRDVEMSCLPADVAQQTTSSSPRL